MIFNKDSKFATEKLFKKIFPMFSNCIIVLNPFTIVNTDGACVIFKTSDGSHFIYSSTSNECNLIGASEDLQNNFTIAWIMKNVLNISVPYTKVLSTYGSHMMETIINIYNFNYKGDKYRIELIQWVGKDLKEETMHYKMSITMIK